MCATEGTVKTPLANRQIDILKADELYADQVKTGPVSLTKENALAIQKDATLIKEGWQVEHILEKRASKPYLEVLDCAGIGYKIGPAIPWWGNIVKIDGLKAREDFDNFLFKMDDQIDALQEEASAAHVNLEMAEGDFERLESLFDKMSAGVPDGKRIDLIILFARYLGELVRKLHGGKWVLPLDDEKNINFNKPVIVGHSPVQGLEFAPITTMRAYALRKRPGTIRQAVMSHVRPQPLDLSDLIED